MRLLLLSMLFIQGCGYDFFDSVERALCSDNLLDCDIEITEPTKAQKQDLRDYERHITQIIGVRGFKIKHFKIVDAFQYDDYEGERVNAVCIPEINGIAIRDDVINGNQVMAKATLYHELLHCMYHLKHINETIMSPNAGNITWIVDNIGVELAVSDMRPFILSGKYKFKH